MFTTIVQYLMMKFATEHYERLINNFKYLQKIRCAKDYFNGSIFHVNDTHSMSNNRENKDKYKEYLKFNYDTFSLFVNKLLIN